VLRFKNRAKTPLHVKFQFSRKQGDQIGKIFAHGAIGFSGQFCLENFRRSPNYVPFFSLEKKQLLFIILTKMGLAILWAFFSKTHLVTLARSDRLQNMGVYIWPEVCIRR
jgi:hypothetical protein